MPCTCNIAVWVGAYNVLCMEWITKSAPWSNPDNPDF